jgi:branched-chain amino acid transport system permease protein
VIQWTATVVNGALLGGVYTIVGLGLALIFGVMRLVNLAHAAFLAGGAYLALTVASPTGLDPLVTLAVVLPVLFCAGYAVQRWLLNTLLVAGSQGALVATFGLLILIQNVLTLSYGADPRSLAAPYADTGLTVFGIRVRVIYVIGLGLSLVCVAGMHLALRRTRLGIALRAATADPVTATTMGVNVNHLYALAFGIGTALAGVGGVVVGVAFSVTPTSGLSYLLLGFTVVVLGGVGSVTGTLAAGLLVGIAEAVAGRVLGGQYADIVVYLAFVVLLAFRPQGLLGRVRA